jgi:hypothetical protein
VNTFSPTRRQFFLWGESQARGVETSPGPVLGLRGGCARLPRQARIGHTLAGDLAVSGRTADIDARISVQASKVADLSKQIADLDVAWTIEPPATGNLRTAAAINAQAAALAATAKLRAAEDERRQAKRNSLADRLAFEAKALG